MAKKVMWIGLLVLVLLAPATLVLADDPVWQFDEGRIFVDEDVVLEAGETVNGDLGVLNGNLTMPAGSSVNGDVFVTNGDADVGGQVNGALAVISGDLSLAETGQVLGDLFVMSGDATIAGQINGDLSVMFGDLELLGSAVVRGDLMVMSGDYERAKGAQVLGQEMPHMSLPMIPSLPSIPDRPLVPPVPAVPDLPELPESPGWTPVPVPAPGWPQEQGFGHAIGRFIGRFLTAGLLGLMMMAVGVLVALIWPRPTRQVSDCIAALPAQSFALGLLTFLIAAGLEALAAMVMILIILVAALLMATIVLIPLGLLLLILSVVVLLPVPLALMGGAILGWVALAELVGRKVLALLRLGDVTPLGAVIVGLLITVSLTGVLWVIKPVCCAWPFVVLLTSLGLGAVFHTRFGRQSCQTPSLSPAPDLLPIEAMEDEIGQPDSP